MQTNLFLYILKHSKRQQLVILAITAASLPFYYLTLEMPKLIVNKALGAEVHQFPYAVTLLGRELLELGQLQWLILLCLVFLLAVSAHGAFKLLLNVYKGRLGEHLLRKLRRELCARVLRFPPREFERVSSQELGAMITAEADMLGSFIGDSFALPLLQGGLLLTAVAYIFAQNVLMGIAALALFSVQGFVIPRLQREVNSLNRQRVLAVRRLSGRLGEAVNLMPEIRASASGRHELGRLDGLLGRIFELRYGIFKRKSFIKFFNNFLFQLTPFIFLLVGGYLVIRGELTIGALVAVLVAYKDLPPPARDLLDYYQSLQDARVRYEQIIAQFVLPQLEPEDYLLEPSTPLEILPGETIEVSELCVGGTQGIDRATFELRCDAHVALLGLSRHQSQALGRTLVRLEEPEQGTIRVGGRNLAELPHSVVGKLFAYVASDPRFSSDTLLENLLYGSGADVDADESRRRAMQSLRTVGMAGELGRLGLDTMIDPARHGDLPARLVAVRESVRVQLAARETQLVEFLERDRYCRHASLGVNLLWGEPLRPDMDLKRLSEHPRVMRALEAAGLLRELLRLGEHAARVVVDDAASELVATPGARPLVREDERPAVRAALARLQASEARRASRADKRVLLTVALRLVAARHHFCPIDADLQTRVVQARDTLEERLPEELRQQTAFFDPGRYNPALTVRENLLFGVLIDEGTHVLERLDTTLLEELDRQDLLPRVAEFALEFDVGVSGSRLRAPERQRLAIARALLRRAPVTVLDHAATELDEGSRRAVLADVRAALTGRCLLCMLDDADIASGFDRVVEFRGGRVVDAGEAARALGRG